LKTKINLAESEANGRILLRTVVHDISNSLTLIKTAHSILELSSKSEEGTPDKALGSILTGLNKASNLVTQIKEIEALQSGKIELHLSEQNLMELVKESAESLSHILKRKNLSLSIVENQKDLKIITNPVSFRISIIENILTNAIKFSPVGSTIEIRLFETINKVGVSIKDHGEGIPKHLIDKLFDKNSKTTRAGSLGEIGTGFGMLIIEAYCDLLGYDLRVRSTTTEESSTKKGTTITILVPKSEIDSNTIAS
jgi:signal transduction histidine kinase